MKRARFVGAVVGVLVGVVLLAGCKVDARVEVNVRDNGSGTVRTTVTIDADAARRLGGVAALSKNVPLGDLERAGWHSSGWKATGTGGATITLTAEFEDQQQLAQRLGELGGANGIVRDPKIERDRAWFSTSDALTVVVDLTKPSSALTRDSALATRLTKAGVDVAALQASLDRQLRSALHVTVVLRLPHGGTETREPVVGAVTTVHASEGGTQWDRLVKVGIAVVLALLAALFFSAATIGARRERRRRRERWGGGDVNEERTPLM